MKHLLSEKTSVPAGHGALDGLAGPGGRTAYLAGAGGCGMRGAAAWLLAEVRPGAGGIHTQVENRRFGVTFLGSDPSKAGLSPSKKTPQGEIRDLSNAFVFLARAPVSLTPGHLLRWKRWIAKKERDRKS